LLCSRLIVRGCHRSLDRFRNSLHSRIWPASDQPTRSCCCSQPQFRSCSRLPLSAGVCQTRACFQSRRAEREGGGGGGGHHCQAPLRYRTMCMALEPQHLLEEFIVRTRAYEFVQALGRPVDSLDTAPRCKGSAISEYVLCCTSRRILTAGGGRPHHSFAPCLRTCGCMLTSTVRCMITARATAC
jgi:hypothetical protein